MFAKKVVNVNAFDISSRAINLPSFHDIRVDQLDKIITVLEQLGDYNAT